MRLQLVRVSEHLSSRLITETRSPDERWLNYEAFSGHLGGEWGREEEKKDGKHVEKELAHEKSRKDSILPLQYFIHFILEARCLQENGPTLPTLDECLSSHFPCFHRRKEHQLYKMI